MSLVQAVVTSALLALGALLMLIAAIGLLRMPDLLMRMQSATKGAALAASLMLLATMVYFWIPEVTARALAAIVFVFLTLPIAAHLLARVAYLTGTQIWQGTKSGMPDPYEEEPELVKDPPRKEDGGE